MFKLKPLHKEAIPAAVKRAEHYRLLNEPSPAESICLDVLDVDPENQQALITLLLALTDQFEQRLGPALNHARQILSRLCDEYHRTYYEGLIWERRANAHLNRGEPGCRSQAYDGYRKAMECYERAERIRPAGNDDSILRWNACARIINRYREPQRAEEEAFRTWLE